MMRVNKQQDLLTHPEDLEGLSKRVKLAMQWADLHFMLENFRRSGSLYREIQ